MTDISVFTQQVLAENLSWYLGTPGDGFVQSDTLDVSLFDATTMYPNGFLPSGLILGRKTSGGLLGPYLDAAADGRQTAVGILMASVQVLQPNGVAKTKLGVGVLKAYAPISVSKLPFVVGTQPLGGYIDAAGKADLPLIYFAA